MLRYFSTGLIFRVSVPPQMTSEAALLAHLGVSPAELKKIWWFRDRMYHEFRIPKGQGKTRSIQAPDLRLKFIQRRIAPLLDQLYRVRNPVHGFVSQRSVKTNANAHLRKRFVLNVDLESFFPTITENRIVGVLESLTVDSRVAKIIAKICCHKGHLPQGAPTSPVLSNMICFRLDKELMAIAKKTRCIYTRYADDITFSSYQPMALHFEATVPSPGPFSPEQLTPTLRNAFASNGFKINPGKCHYADRHSRRMVTGLKINEFINVDRRYVRNIRAALYSAETLGTQAAQEKLKTRFGKSADLGAHLRGKISWLGYIRGQSDPVFRAIAVRFNSSFPGHKIKVVPSSDEVRSRAVWVVEHFEGEWAQGSAFFLRGIGLVTAAHCVVGAKELDVYHPSKPANKFKATVSKLDNDRDVAVLSHTIPETEYFDLEKSSNQAAVSDELIAVGYPGFGPGDAVNVREGTVSSLPTKNNVKLIEVTQKLAQGMSGGPLVRYDNSVVGIIHKGGPHEARDFAIHIDELMSWLAP